MLEMSGLLPRVLLEAQAIAVGANPDRYIADRLAEAAARGFNIDDPEWRHAWETWTPPPDRDTPGPVVTVDVGPVNVTCPECGGHNMTNGYGSCDMCNDTGWVPAVPTTTRTETFDQAVDGLASITDLEPGGRLHDEPVEADTEIPLRIRQASSPRGPAVAKLLASAAPEADLPVRRRTPPPKPAPPQPKRADPLAIRFARQVLDDPAATPGVWVRLDRPVSRSIVSKKAREWAEAYGVRFRVREDLLDPDDKTSPRGHFLFCMIAEPHTVELDG